MAGIAGQDAKFDAAGKPDAKLDAKVAKVGGKGGGANPAGLMYGLGPYSIPANSPLLNPNQTLSGSSLWQAGRALADIQTTGPLTEIARSIAANNSQGQAAEGLTHGYFTDLGQYAKAGVQDERQIGNALNSQLARIGGQENAALQGVEQNAQNSFNRYMPHGGQPGLGSPGWQALTQEIARQRGLGIQDNNSFRRFGALQGANYSGLAASNLGSYAQRGAESLADIARATQLENLPLNAKAAALIAERGALTAADIGKLRQGEITNKFTAQGLQIRKQLANAATQNANTAASAAKGNLSLNAALDAARINNLNASSALDAAKQAHLGQGPKLSLSKQNQYWGTVQSLTGVIDHLHQAGNNDNNKIVSGLKSKGYDPNFIHMAMALLGWGFITPQDWGYLQSLGFQSPPDWNGQPVPISDPTSQFGGVF